MSRRDRFEDDGHPVADMSGLESPGLFGKRSSRTGRKNYYSVSENESERKPWEEAPFTWGERLRYMGVALGAALSIALVVIEGLALVIWLIMLYA